MSWKENAVRGAVLAGVACGAGWLATRSRHPQVALFALTVAFVAGSAAAYHYKIGAGAACRQLPGLEGYCRALT